MLTIMYSLTCINHILSYICRSITFMLNKAFIKVYHVMNYEETHYNHYNQLVYIKSITIYYAHLDYFPILSNLLGLWKIKPHLLLTTFFLII